MYNKLKYTLLLNIYFVHYNNVIETKNSEKMSNLVKATSRTPISGRKAGESAHINSVVGNNNVIGPNTVFGNTSITNLDSTEHVHVVSSAPPMPPVWWSELKTDLTKLLDEKFKSISDKLDKLGDKLDEFSDMLDNMNKN